MADTSHGTQITVAVISVFGVVATGLFANWDKIFKPNGPAVPTAAASAARPASPSTSAPSSSAVARANPTQDAIPAPTPAKPHPTQMPALQAPTLAIKAPMQAENGANVPVSVTIKPEIREGDVLLVLVNDSVVCQVRPTGSVALSEFSLRVRMASSGQIRAVVNKQGGQTSSSSANVNVLVGAVIPASGDPNVSQKVDTRDGVKALFINKMARDSHIKHIRFKLDSGTVQVSTTPWISANPVIGFKTTGSVEGVIVTALLN